MKTFTWKNLADAIACMPPDQLDKQVHVAIEDEHQFRKLEAIDVLPHDIYVNIEDDEDCGPLEELKEIYGEDFEEENYKLSTPQGFHFLWDGF